MSAVLEIGFSAAPVYTGIDRVEKRLRGFDQQVANVGKGRAGGGLSNMSFQLQDIAVQLQSGTKASIIFAQQGSQMLSAFGPAGAVAGTIAAIGGALYSGAEASQAAFAQMTLDMETYRSTLERTLSVIDVENVGSAVEGLTARIKAAQAEQAKLYTSSGQLFAIIASTFLGDKTAEEKTNQLARMQFELGDAYGRMAEAAVNASAKQAKVVALRAAGDNKAADALQRQIDLNKKLAGIDAMDLPVYAKDALKSDATATSAAEEKTALLNLQKQIEEKQLELAYESLDVADKVQSVTQNINDLLREEDDLRSQGKLDAMAQADIDLRRLNLQERLNQLMRQYEQEAEKAASSRQREADEADRANTQRRNAVMNTAQEYKLLEARATGRKRAIEDAEREIGIEQRRDRLMKENGLNKTEATALATKMQNMEEKANNGGRSPRIRGVQAEHRMSGLSSFYDVQRGPGALEKLQGRESAFDKLQRTPSAFDQLQQRASADRLGPQNQRNAVEPTPAKPISPDDFLQKILTLLPKGIADALLN
jgi:hypothetical protein